MPTGYTHVIDGDELTTKQWIMEHLARAFGLCIALREEDSGLSEEVILAKLQLDDSFIKYHVKRLDEDKKKYVMLLKLNDEEWKLKMEESNTKINEGNNKSIEKASKIKKQHDAKMTDLVKVKESDVSEVTRNIVNFGIQQLELVKSECEPYTTELHEDLQKYKEDKIASAKRGIEYHIKEKKDAEKRYKECIESYKELRKDIYKIL